MAGGPFALISGIYLSTATFFISFESLGSAGAVQAWKEGETSGVVGSPLYVQMIS